MANYFLGIDVGTYETKGVIIDERCNIIADATAKHGMENPKPNYFEHDAEKVWWHDICAVSKELLSKSGIKNNEIKAMGVSALNACVVPVDEECRPLRKAILYGIDARADAEIEFIEKYYGDERCNQLFNGRPLCSSDCMPKILWIKNNEPDIYKKTFKFLTSSSYITAKLTGSYVIDRFLALSSFAPCYRSDLSLDGELCEELYCRPDQLAEGRETTDVVGHITKTAANETGLAEGTPVITGTDDSGAEAISTGVTKPGDLMIQLGSTCYIIYCSDKMVTDERIWSEDYIIPGTFSIDGGTNAAGALTKWLRDTIYPDFLDKQDNTGIDAYAMMAENAKDIPAGSGGVVTLPYFAGERTPINDQNAKGVIFGLQLHHTRAHIYRSALEGVAYSIAQHIDIMEEHGLKIDKLTAVGGGTKNPLWLQIIADVTGHTVCTADVTIGASYGDAMMSAIGVGCIKSYAELSNYIKPGAVLEPNPDNYKTYKHLKEIYGKLYSSTKELMHNI